MQNDSKQANPHIEAVIFTQDDFGSSSEETIYILHAQVTEFEDTHVFLNEAKQIYTDLIVYAEDQPRSIGQAEFARLLEERTHGLAQPLPDFILTPVGVTQLSVNYTQHDGRFTLKTDSTA